ncbi:hypothetical protein ACLOJK_026344 [Asimina triloba]
MTISLLSLLFYIHGSFSHPNRQHLLPDFLARNGLLQLPQHLLPDFLDRNGRPRMPAMLTALSSPDDSVDGGDDSPLPSCWWRSANQLNGCIARLKVDVASITSLSPRIKILRELERLALMAPEALDDIRHKLASYRAGDFWLPTGGVKKEDMNIPPVITILLVGFAGSGKTSLVNMMYSVLGRAGLIPFAQSSAQLKSGFFAGYSANYQTKFLEEHNVLRSTRNGFCVFDTGGVDYDRMGESLERLSEWMADGVQHHQPCTWSGDDEGALSWLESSRSKYARRRVNCPVLVANAAEIYRAFKGGNSRPLEATRELFYFPAIRRCNENPMLILTHGDELSAEERLGAREKICEFLGVSVATGAYDIVCLTEHGILAAESDPVTAYTLAEATYRALLFSDRSHAPRTTLKEEALAWLSWAMWSIAAFFAFLACCFSKLGNAAAANKKLK